MLSTLPFGKAVSVMDLLLILCKSRARGSCYRGLLTACLIQCSGWRRKVLVDSGLAKVHVDFKFRRGLILSGEVAWFRS